MNEINKVLLQKPIYEFLEGSGKHDLVNCGKETYGLPYYTASELYNLCSEFGVPDDEIEGGSRWCQMGSLVEYAVKNDKVDELFCYLFKQDKFGNLNDLPSMDDIHVVHEQIVEEAIKEINLLIRLSEVQLVRIKGHYQLVRTGEELVIVTDRIDHCSSSYVHGLMTRCEEDLQNCNYDSVVTKSRTMVEEIIIHALEQDGITPDQSGNLGKLYAQFKNQHNMKQSGEQDKRGNNLLSAWKRSSLPLLR